jgi:hypothetical protein
VDVEKSSDELWLGVKGQSNSGIARSPRKIFRYRLRELIYGGRALTGLGAIPGYQTLSNSEYRKSYPWTQSLGAKVQRREGKSPDRQLRSLNLC